MPHEITSGGTLEAPSAFDSHTRTVVFIVWPEYGHIVAPLSLAKRLKARGDKVVFAAAPQCERPLRSIGYDFVSLACSAGEGPSLFEFISTRTAFERAVDALARIWRSMLDLYSPDLVLLDSLYSCFSVLAEADGVAWAQYETDLPREYHFGVPPPHLLVEPRPDTYELIEAAWVRAIARRQRACDEARSNASVGLSWAAPYFPTLLLEELQRRFRTRVDFDHEVVYGPVARGPRMVFCPRAFDFPRRKVDGLSWVGPCIDPLRREPAFDFSAIDSSRKLAYCALGTQSARDSAAFQLLESAIDVFSERSDYMLVIACTAELRARLRPDRRTVIVVQHAPQLSLLRRACLVLSHAGFNTLKECAWLGVPVIALPLGHDQPRNAALVLFHRIGTAIPAQTVTPAALSAAVEAVSGSEEITACSKAMKTLFELEQTSSGALEFIDNLLPGPKRRFVTATGRS
jgi:zeaxanthin glucosyltransferase